MCVYGHHLLQGIEINSVIYIDWGKQNKKKTQQHIYWALDDTLNRFEYEL